MYIILVDSYDTRNVFIINIISLCEWPGSVLGQSAWVSGGSDGGGCGCGGDLLRNIRVKCPWSKFGIRNIITNRLSISLTTMFCVVIPKRR